MRFRHAGPSAAEQAREEGYAVQRRVYGYGLRDGAATTLKLLIGLEAEGGAPYPGVLPDEVREWAMDALDRITRETGL